MQVYLLRHGIAEKERDGLRDADRALTEEGRKKLRQVLQVAFKTGMNPSLILTSPLKRAIQTAELAKKVLGSDTQLHKTEALVPNATPDQPWAEIRSHRTESAVLLVGHNPLFSDLARYLLHSPHLQIDFKKGALMRVDFEHIAAHPSGILRWYLTPKMAGVQESS